MVNYTELNPDELDQVVGGLDEVVGGLDPANKLGEIVKKSKSSDLGATDNYSTKMLLNTVSQNKGSSLIDQLNIEE